MPQQIYVCAKSNWRVCIAYNKIQCRTKMIFLKYCMYYVSIELYLYTIQVQYLRVASQGSGLQIIYNQPIFFPFHIFQTKHLPSVSQARSQLAYSATSVRILAFYVRMLLTIFIKINLIFWKTIELIQRNITNVNFHQKRVGSSWVRMLQILQRVRVVQYLLLEKSKLSFELKWQEQLFRAFSKILSKKTEREVAKF